jgi:hypothetical protein
VAIVSDTGSSFCGTLDVKVASGTWVRLEFLAHRHFGRSVLAALSRRTYIKSCEIRAVLASQQPDDEFS